MSARDPITTHVLDSTTGKPAAGVRATLTLIGGASPGPSWTATTSSSDGRINTWDQGSETSLKNTIASLASGSTDSAQSDATTWSLCFDTQTYWGGPDKTFYPEVEIRFFLKPGEQHYHVPLLLGPWGYTTYRGS